MFRVIYRFAAALGLLSAAAPAVAQTPPPQFSVSVTERADIVEEVGTTRRIDRAEIEALHARTLDEVLRLVPGVYVRTGGEGTPRIDLRGWRTRHVLILVDGVPVNSTEDGQFDPTRIPVELIREVKVSYGASSVLYGENATAGVIEITTEPLAVGLRGGADVDLRQGSQQRGSLHVAGGTERVSALLTGSAWSRDGYPVSGRFAPTPNEDGDLRTNSDLDRRSALAKIGYRLSEAVTLGGLVSVGDGAHGVPPATVEDPDDPFAQRVRYERVEGSRTLTSQLSVAADPNDAFGLRAWTFFNEQAENRVRYDDATYSSIDDPLVSGTYRRRDASRSTGGAVHGRYELGEAGRLRFAFNTRRERFGTAGIIRDLELAAGGGGGGGGGGRGGGGGTARRFELRAFDTEQHVDVSSTGAEWEIRPTPLTGLAFGYSQSWQRRSGADEGGSSWLVGVTRQVSADLALRASVSRRIRFASLRQLYEEETGNPDLEPERSHGAEVGAEWRVAGPGGSETIVNAAAFWMRADGFIERDDDDRFFNRDRYRFSGFETTLETDVLPALDLRIGYSRLDAADRSPGTARDQLPNRPRHRFTADGRWDLPADLWVRGAVYAVAGAVEYSRRGPLQQARADAYALVDVAVGRAFGPESGERVVVTAGIDNLFDQLYEDGYALPREGRVAFLRVQGQF